MICTLNLRNQPSPVTTLEWATMFSSTTKKGKFGKGPLINKLTKTNETGSITIIGFSSSPAKKHMQRPAPVTWALSSTTETLIIIKFQKCRPLFIRLILLRRNYIICRSRTRMPPSSIDSSFSLLPRQQDFNLVPVNNKYAVNIPIK